MRRLLDGARGLVDRALRRRFLPEDVAPPPPPSVGLDELTVHPGAAFVANTAPGASVAPLPDGRHCEFTTADEIWSYAAHLKFDPQGFPSSGDLLVRVDLWVVQGTIGVGVTRPDGEFLNQQMRTVGDGRTAIDFYVRAEEAPTEVIVRNAGRRAAKAVVERVQVYRVREGAREPAAPISDRSRPIGEAFALPTPAGAASIDQPLVSLILTVKDGMPYLAEALESVRAQTYRNIELVVQDALSTDGSSELLAGFDGAATAVVREKDGGIGDANNRALSRCRGTIIGSVDSDNLMDPNAVMRAVDHFAGHPGDAVVYGSVRMIAASGAEEGVFRPGPHDFLRFVGCDLGIPWSTAFFNRPVCGEALWLDPQLKTCADYDAWLRLGHLPIAFIDQVQGSTRVSDASMTCNPDNYEQFCRDKALALKRYVDTCAHEPLRAALIRQGMVGIYCWAAESLKGLAPDRTDLIADFHERARAVDPASARVALSATRLF